MQQWRCWWRAETNLLKAEIDQEKGLLNGKFNLKALPAGSLSKNKVIYIYCLRELSY